MLGFLLILGCPCSRAWAHILWHHINTEHMQWDYIKKRTSSQEQDVLAVPYKSSKGEMRSGCENKHCTYVWHYQKIKHFKETSTVMYKRLVIKHTFWNLMQRFFSKEKNIFDSFMKEKFHFEDCQFTAWWKCFRKQAALQLHEIFDSESNQFQSFTLSPSFFNRHL